MIFGEQILTTSLKFNNIIIYISSFDIRKTTVQEFLYNHIYLSYAISITSIATQALVFMPVFTT